VQFDVTSSSPAGHVDRRESDRAYRTEKEWRRLAPARRAGIARLFASDAHHARVAGKSLERRPRSRQRLTLTGQA
jgi:hypothetical protein